MSYEAYEKLDALQEVVGLLERAKDAIAGMRFIGIECDIEDTMHDVWLELSDLEDDLKAENDMELEEELRDYYRSR